MLAMVVTSCSLRFSLPKQVGSTDPIEKVVEMEEDLHIFALVGAVYGAGPAAQTPATRRGDDQPDRSKATTLRQESTFAAPQEHQADHAPSKYDEYARTGRIGGGWGMPTGQETPCAQGHEEQRSAAIPRAFTMNVDVVSKRYGDETTHYYYCTKSSFSPFCRV